MRDALVRADALDGRVVHLGVLRAAGAPVVGWEVGGDPEASDQGAIRGQSRMFSRGDELVVWDT